MRVGPLPLALFATWLASAPGQAGPVPYPTYVPPPTPIATPVATPSSPLGAASNGVVAVHIYDAANRHLRILNGFMVSPTEVVTSIQLMMGADHAVVDTANGERIPVVGVDGESENDFLVRLQLAAAPRQAKPLNCCTAPVQDGESIYLVSAREGTAQGLADGIVASASRTLPRLGKVIQITAPASLENVGAPVVDAAGEVVGVFVYQQTKGQNLNFAAPVARVLDMKGHGLQKIAAWNNARPSNRSAAAIGCQLFFQSLAGQNYSAAWAMLTRLTQAKFVAMVSQGEHVDASEALSILEGTSSNREAYQRFWSDLSRDLHAPDHASGAYTAAAEDAQAAVVLVVDGAHPELLYKYVMILSSTTGAWQIGIFESAIVLRPK